PVANPLSLLNEPENNADTKLADTKLTSKKLATVNSAKVLLKLDVLGSNQTLYASISCISLSRLKLDVGMQVIARFKLP
ncbi:MAG: molybdenum ABC transporter ATP-binding protein, partial [Pseudomonadota bacterium]|nr:molybdenum ABC transporter ATP-binding protein [Pseudomonadota bacterium]